MPCSYLLLGVPKAVERRIDRSGSGILDSLVAIPTIRRRVRMRNKIAHGRAELTDSSRSRGAEQQRSGHSVLSGRRGASGRRGPRVHPVRKQTEQEVQATGIELERWSGARDSIKDMKLSPNAVDAKGSGTCMPPATGTDHTGPD